LKKDPKIKRCFLLDVQQTNDKRVKERATYVLNEPAEVTFFVFNQSAFVSSYSAVIMRPLIWTQCPTGDLSAKHCNIFKHEEEQPETL